MADLDRLKVASRAREGEEKRQAERRRAVLVLILRHLADSGYVDAYERLSSESNVHLNKVDVADNIDLVSVVQEFEESYELKYGRRPKLIKRLVDEVVGGGGAVRTVPASGAAGRGGGSPPPPYGVAGRSSSAGAPGAPPGGRPPPGHGALDGPPVSGAMAARNRRDAGVSRTADDEKKREQLEKRRDVMNKYAAPSDVGGQRIAGVNVGGHGVAGGPEELAGFPGVQGVAPGKHGSGAAGSGGGADDGDDDPDERFQNRVVKGLPPSLQGELRELGHAITRDIFTDNPNVRWDDVSGLEQAKKLLKEAVVQPIKYPELFTGLLAPWKGVLLYGPPGTGKTMLAKAVATECRTTFFNIHASSIISKWRGDSEKLVRVLFDLARYHAPSTIFLDEIDALMGARGGEGEHEASRRMKTEILVQMDGLTRSNHMVFVLAATNLPWELDQAMLRRLEKRIFVPLPEVGARLRMLTTLLEDRVGPDVSLQKVAESTDGFSGSDMMLVAKEAAMRPLRRLMAQLEAAPADDNDRRARSRLGPGGKAVSAAAAAGQPQELGPISTADFDAALTVTKASARRYEAEYAAFSTEYGQLGA
ncbi:hypothetical protein FOA52_008295 [Chlamydomonas sp. UWO 241]|nr:hypothetical protein FOA52_008295 [Chlamydomonas sp. UWO 241]